MLKRTAVILILVAVAVVSGLVYFYLSPPAGVAPKGETTEMTVAWISLTVAVMSMVTAVVGLFQRILEFRASAFKEPKA